MKLNDLHKQIVCSLYKVANDYEGKIKCIVKGQKSFYE